MKTSLLIHFTLAFLATPVLAQVHVPGTASVWDRPVTAVALAGLAADAPNVALVVFPNPATTSATVRFSLESAQHVVLDVFDLLGRRIGQRELGVLSAGEHEIALDLRRLPAGLYIVRLTGDAGARATVRLTVATTS